MALNPENLRFILGLKLKNLRQDRGLSLKALAESAGLSISYLSEIEKGRKYPKPNKLLDLASALDVPYDELVSMRVTEELVPLKSLFSSSFIQEFPFHLFGLGAEDLMGLITDEPGKAGALIRTLLEIGRVYDVQVEHFLFAALRSYQQLHMNHFPDLEERAAALRAEHGWTDRTALGEGDLRRVLEEEHGYRIDLETLPDEPHLQGFRSVFAEGEPPTLFVNGRLMPSQRAFVLGRELGYRALGVTERAVTSSWLEVESFDQVLNNFRASYVSGALLIDGRSLTRDLAAFFEQPTWDGDGLLRLLGRYQVTPEMLMYRLTELLPARFGLKELFFMRFSNEAGTERYGLTKVFNMSRVPVPHGISLGEHYCRRWPALKLLRVLAARQEAGQAGGPPLVSVQRSHFLDEDAAFFILSIARPLALQPGTNACVSVGFLIDDALRERVRFLDDPAIPRVTVNLTCERCGLAPTECLDRVVPATIHEAQVTHAEKVDALEAFLDRHGG